MINSQVINMLMQQSWVLVERPGRLLERFTASMK